MDFENLSVASIDSYITELNSKLLPVNEELLTIYTIDSLKNKPIDEIKIILEKYNIDIKYADYFEIISTVDNNELLSTTLYNNITSIKNILNNIIEQINNQIRTELNIIENNNKTIQEQIEFYKKLKEYISSSFTYSAEEYLELTNLILNSHLTKQEKVNLSKSISKIILSMAIEKTNIKTIEEDKSEPSLTDITSFDDDLEIAEIEEEKPLETAIIPNTISDLKKEQIACATTIFNKFRPLFQKNNFTTDIEEVNENFTLAEIEEELAKNQLSVENYLAHIAIIICKIKDINLSSEEAEKYVDLLKNYEELYETNITEASNLKANFKHALEKFNKKINDIYAILNKLQKVDNAIYDKLSELRQTMLIIEEEINNLDQNPFIDIEIIKNNLDNIISNLNYIHSNLSDDKQTKSTNIKSFILFDIDKKTGKPYMYDDILGKKETIEEQAIISSDASNVDINYEHTISKLIKDLMRYGTCEYMLSVNSSSANKSEKIEQQVCETDSNGNVNRDKKTELWRIRPIPTSNVRFVDKKIIIPCNSVLFTQVKEIIQKYLPNVIISNDEDFTIIVNIICGIKKSDKSLYRAAIDRYENKDSFPLSLFYESGNYRKSSRKPVVLKKSLSDEDLKKLDELIKTSLELYNEMHKQDNNYDFAFISEMGGEKKYGI